MKYAPLDESLLVQHQQKVNGKDSDLPVSQETPVSEAPQVSTDTCLHQCLQGVQVLSGDGWSSRCFTPQEA